MFTLPSTSRRRAPTLAFWSVVAGLAASIWLGHQLGVQAITVSVADFMLGLAVGVGLAALLVRLSDGK